MVKPRLWDDGNKSQAAAIWTLKTVLIESLKQMCIRDRYNPVLLLKPVILLPVPCTLNLVQTGRMSMFVVPVCLLPVSYTHLDVYKRQRQIPGIVIISSAISWKASSGSRVFGTDRFFHHRKFNSASPAHCMTASDALERTKFAQTRLICVKQPYSGRTGHTCKFYILRAKSTVLAMSRPARVWLFDADQPGPVSYTHLRQTS